jgi:phosphoglycolate phosphatase-like HAD superfamily hydrolase
MRSPYDILGIDASADAEAIKAAFRKLSLEHHPDRNPGDDAAAKRMVEVNAEEKRAAFDATGAGWGPEPDPLAEILAGVRTAAVDVAEQQFVPEVVRCLRDIRQGGSPWGHTKAAAGRFFASVLEKVIPSRG